MHDLAQQFKALSEDVRLRILALIFRHGELCVCEIERFLQVTQSKASRHLRYLLNAGLVEDRRDGLWVYYRAAEPTTERQRTFLAALRDMLADLPVPDVADELEAMRAERCQPTSAKQRAVTSAGAEVAS
ncbi:MAG: metalloregulator ArsR/SmtB family transcription factor [Gemmatimonadetes bacterium]|nr:metalloregulator ArsR/SmtB family transcription factor [Gemmatimonadota bacterium]